jgi:hypothetical protein
MQRQPEILVRHRHRRDRRERPVAVPALLEHELVVLPREQEAPALGDAISVRVDEVVALAHPELAHRVLDALALREHAAVGGEALVALARQVAVTGLAAQIPDLVFRDAHLDELGDRHQAPVRDEARVLDRARVERDQELLGRHAPDLDAARLARALHLDVK